MVEDGRVELPTPRCKRSVFPTILIPRLLERIGGFEPLSVSLEGCRATVNTIPAIILYLSY